MSYKTTGHAPEEEVVEVVASGDAEAQEKLAKYGITNPSFLGAGNFGRGSILFNNNFKSVQGNKRWEDRRSREIFSQKFEMYWTIRLRCAE